MILADAAIEVQVGRITERVDGLEERFNRHEAKQNGSLDKIWSELRDMRKEQQIEAQDLKETIHKELAGRPTWAVTIIVALLMTVATGLSVYVITH